MGIIKILVAPDSFKDSFSALRIAQMIKSGILKVIPEAEILCIPLSDGGEGFVSSILQVTGGLSKSHRVSGPLGDPVVATWGILQDNRTAIIEMSAASGLPLVPLEKRNPLKTTTFGTGELIREALNHGCDRIILGIGGSATVDGGMGMAQALGVKFYDEQGKTLGLGGDNLQKIHHMDLTDLDPRVFQTKFEVACDVKNVLCGNEGAAFIYGPQKGATPEMVKILDQGLENFAQRIYETLGLDVKNRPGAGAAGGLGAGAMAFLRGEILTGFDVISQVTDLKRHIESSDLVITGEGRTDLQTKFGKVPMGVALLAKQYHVPVFCISGSLGEGYEQLYPEGITACFSIIDKPMSLTQVIANTPLLLEKTVENVLRVWVF